MLAEGLKADYVTRNAGNMTDMMVLWPPQEPTHLITCVEGTRERLSDGRYNPSVQRIGLVSGRVDTILRGMDRCDGIRITDWGTVLVTEETTDGGAYEILDPVATTDESVLDRATGAVTAPDKVGKRPALPTMAWEGLAVLPSGVVIGGDELRPGVGGADRDGGAIFKFIPDLPHGNGRISELRASPLVAGKSYAFRVDCWHARAFHFPQYGQGCEVGNGAWIQVRASKAREDADARGATGYYRPEDLHLDPGYTGEGVRFCWANTGMEAASNFGEVVCGVDYEPLVADDSRTTVVVGRFVEGDRDFNSLDNLAFQPATGILYVTEDHRNGDVFACLPDGADRDLKTDGCVRVVSVVDQTAEPTGLLFSADGTRAYLSIQHSDDSIMSDFDGYPTDDVLVISGFSMPTGSRVD